MRIVNEFVFHGPSVFSRAPATQFTVEPSALSPAMEHCPVRDLLARLRELAPRMPLPWPNAEADMRTAAQLDGLSQAQLMAAVTLGLQAEDTPHLEFFQAYRCSAPSQFFAVCEHHDVNVSVVAGRTAVSFLDALMTASAGPEAVAQLGNAQEKFQNFISKRLAGVDSAKILQEARRRNIPWSRPHGQIALVQFGQGHKTRRLRANTTDRTSEIAVRLSTIKHITNGLLADAGIPVPVGSQVDDADSAVATARRLGFPVVTKPATMDKGIGVQINLHSDEDVRQAFAISSQHGAVLVEQQISGYDHRLTVIDGRMVAAVRTMALYIVGDGRSTVRELIAQAKTRQVPVIDDEIRGSIDREGLTLDSVATEGRHIALRNWWRQHTDHLLDDVTAVVHPVNRAVAERAVRLLGLDIAGVDFISVDIGRPYYEVGAAINEVNPFPAISGHARAGSPHIYRAVLEHLFPPGEDGRIPVGMVLGDRDAASVCAIVSAILQRSGHVVGMAGRDGIRIGGQYVADGNRAGPDSTRGVLRDSAVTAAVFELDVARILSEGLGVDMSSVTAVMDSPPPELPGAGAFGADLARACYVRALDIARDMAVMDAESAFCQSLAGSVRAKRLCWVSLQPADQRLLAHTRSGGTAVTVEPAGADAEIILWDFGRRVRVAALGSVVAAGAAGGRSAVRSVLFACAIAHGLGVSPEIIGDALTGAAPAGV